jgi:hypothetical protein
MGGNLEVLKWCRGKGFPWDETETTCAKAAESGHLDILKWCRNNGCPWDSDNMKWARRSGNEDLLQWCIDNINHHHLGGYGGGTCCCCIEWVSVECVGSTNGVCGGHIRFFPYGPNLKLPIRMIRRIGSTTTFS